MSGNHLEKTARAMLSAAQQGADVSAVLARRCPQISRQLHEIRQARHLLSLWGRCRNFDENAHAEIVEPIILEAIGELADVPMRGRIVHAGLQHTYGYLFSLIETPFGYKRDRWIRRELDAAFGFESPTLRACPAAGTLLTNLTWFLGQIAFAARPADLRRLHRDSAFVAPVVRDYDYDMLTGRRIVEEIALPASHSRRIKIVTHLVNFPRKVRGSGNTALLVYSIVGGVKSPARLVTAFPISLVVLKELCKDVGDKVAVRLRYNGWYPGLSAAPLIGKRYVLDQLSE